jgi:integrase
MSRRKGQNPSVRSRFDKTAGAEKYFFQYWRDVPGQNHRQRVTVNLGLKSQLTKSEAERKKLEFMSNLMLNSVEYQIPSSATFADAVRHYREDFAPRMLRPSTISVAESRFKIHLEPDWSDVPIEHITIKSVNDWAWKKRQSGLSWVTIKDALRTMQRALSALPNGKPPFSLNGLAIPERDKLQMKIRQRQNVSFTWEQALLITGQIRCAGSLGDYRREQYATLVLLAAASGLRSSELLALKINDLNFEAGTIRVDESSDQRSNGAIGPCKNEAAYRTVVLRDPEGVRALEVLHAFVGPSMPDRLVFRSRSGGPLLETTILSQGFHPALKALGLPKGGLHGLRRGCNRRWALSGITPAVIRQQMGHTSERMTTLYTGEIPLEEIEAAFRHQVKSGGPNGKSENKENGVTA